MEAERCWWRSCGNPRCLPVQFWPRGNIPPFCLHFHSMRFCSLTMNHHPKTILSSSALHVISEDHRAPGVPRDSTAWSPCWPPRPCSRSAGMGVVLPHALSCFGVFDLADSLYQEGLTSVSTCPNPAHSPRLCSWSFLLAAVTLEFLSPPRGLCRLFSDASWHLVYKLIRAPITLCLVFYSYCISSLGLTFLATPWWHRYHLSLYLKQDQA